MNRKIIFDCDPGVDDAIALLLAFSAPKNLSILGVTTLAGNVDAALTARNACLIRDIAGCHNIPIFAGCKNPLLREAVKASHFHGVSGLGNLPIFEPHGTIEIESAVDFIVRILSQAKPKEITLVITGPMTNIATAIQRDPNIIQGLYEIVVMGGACSEGGNITASAEYNIYADPHAAKIVFNTSCELIVFGLDATHQVRATPKRIATLRKGGTRSALVAADLLEFSSTLPGNGSKEIGAPLHDPCPIAWLLAPQLFELQECYLEVETQSTAILGHTAVDFRIRAHHPAHVRWAVRADGQGIFDLLTDLLTSA
ncbi:MAG: nucleoside hydrolase [Gammaproteobacteria bacterium]|nr:nucleoside hydrolase [Gammaproteobacteria bacterium]